MDRETGASVWGGRLHSLCLGLLFPIALLAPKGLVPLFILATLAVIAAGLPSRSAVSTLFSNRVYWTVAGFLAYAAASAFWSIDPLFSLKKALLLALFPVGAVLLFEGWSRLPQTVRQRSMGWLAVGMTLCIVYVLVDHTLGYALTEALKTAAGNVSNTQGFRNYGAALSAGLSVLSIAVWPVVTYLYVRYGLLVAALITGGAVIALMIGESQTGALAVGAGAAVFLLARFVLPSRTVGWIVLAVFCAALFVTPLMTRAIDWRDFRHIPADHWIQTFPPSTYHRMVIYGFVTEHIAERPIFGHGLGTSRFIPGNNDTLTGTRDIAEPDGQGGTTIRRVDTFNAVVNLLPLHPHNIGLQLWLELGVPGVALAALFFFQLVRRIGQLNDRIQEGVALSALTAWIVNSLLAFGIWQEWWLSAALFTLALTRTWGHTIRDA